uniref:Uncharacterized protein n=1 Tax=Leptocylindrus danicus TaxID=163516 RepID=A0A7S2P2C8_9STRA|mmetsp:Transcript_21343/g.31878  ORF Transcript_21343/g.31878 Transcript_21343/m.31878 type:complete len:120 (+) Transcript_21343:463-822(+)
MMSLSNCFNLFSSCMFECRDYGLDVGEAWQAACAKVERRTPYMNEWGDGKSNANSSEEATQLWKTAKAEEKGTSQNLFSVNKPSMLTITIWKIANCHATFAIVGFLAGAMIFRQDKKSK